jgi:hypothetical protein
LLQKRVLTPLKEIRKKISSKTSHFNIAIEEIATRIAGTRTEVEVDVKQLDNKVDSNVTRIDCKLAKLDKEVCVMKDAIRENSDVILRRQGERVEQIQLQIRQEKVTVENKLEKLHSQIAESRELALARNIDDSVPRTLRSAGENINDSNDMDVPTNLDNINDNNDVDVPTNLDKPRQHYR